MKTAELSGRALDYAVALAEGAVWVPQEPARWGYLKWPTEPPTHSSRAPDYVNSPAGDEIIDRELIATRPRFHAAGYHHPEGKWYWTAQILGENDMGYEAVDGATRREAAMRAWAVHKLGPEITVPEVLL